MRELKFRVWDTKNKQFLSQSSEYYHIGDITGIPYTLNEILNKLDRFVVQQFTGLYDKNKKPIYEGDIIKYTRLIEKERRIVELFSFIKFQDAKFGFDLTGFNDMFYDLSDEPDFEVVGNIFENSELLKQ